MLEKEVVQQLGAVAAVEGFHGFELNAAAARDDIDKIAFAKRIKRNLDGNL